MKTLKMGIASYDAMKARTLAIARGELKPKPGDPQVWFTSTVSFTRSFPIGTARCWPRLRCRHRPA